MDYLVKGLLAVSPQQILMYFIGGFLFYLAIGKKYEPAHLLPMGFGAILVNFPYSGVLNQNIAGISAFPMSARVVQKMATEENPGNIIIMHAVGANVSG